MRWTTAGFSDSGRPARETNIGYRPSLLDFRAKGLRDTFRGALAAGDAADIGGIAAELLSHAVIETAAKRGQAPQVRDGLGILRAVYKVSLIFSEFYAPDRS